jgi:F420-dependent oxidoreductase-like protein
MKLGIHFANISPADDATAQASTLAETAKTAEEVGCEWFTMMDHWFQMEDFGGPEQPMLEGYSSLAFVAGQTRRIHLGLLVTGVTYRHPGLLAKTVTTLDVLSGGRAILGIGAAWYEREHVGLGVPFPPVSERFERLDETLKICRQMWSDNNGTFEGKHYHLAETRCSPPPIQQPHPPIMIGGVGEKKTLRLVAQYADVTNMFDLGPDVIKDKLDALNRHCEAVDRDPATIRKTILGFADPLADTDAFLHRMEQYAALGIDLVDIMPSSTQSASRLQRVVVRNRPRCTGEEQLLHLARRSVQAPSHPLLSARPD